MERFHSGPLHLGRTAGMCWRLAMRIDVRPANDILCCMTQLEKGGNNKVVTAFCSSAPFYSFTEKETNNNKKKHFLIACRAEGG